MNLRSEKVKIRIHQILEVADPGDHASKVSDVFLMSLIVLNVVAVILGTVESLYDQYAALFRDFELFSVAIFTVEYLLRVWSCTVDQRFRDPTRGRIRFALTPLPIVDLVAILPFYLPLIFVDLRFLRALRLFRLFRLFKMARYSESMRTMSAVLRLKKEELTVTFFALAIMLIFSSSLVYYVEHETQPDNFSSIPAAMWWGIVTLTTVGYGDVYPVTPVGKLIGTLVIILGIGMFALPAGILASGFVEEVQIKRECKQEEREIICPHCGRRIDQPPERRGQD